MQNNYQPIYNFTVEEVTGSKNLLTEQDTRENRVVLETKLYPNPNNGLFTIKHTDLIKSIHISDMYGKTLFSKTYFDIGNALNFSLYLKPGVYFATINNSVQIKFIVL